jgi:hypothetical protein
MSEISVILETLLRRCGGHYSTSDGVWLMAKLVSVDEDKQAEATAIAMLAAYDMRMGKCLEFDYLADNLNPSLFPPGRDRHWHVKQLEPLRHEMGEEIARWMNHMKQMPIAWNRARMLETSEVYWRTGEIVDPRLNE